MKDGTLLDRYSSPVVGKDGKYYGRIWTFRDITEQRRTEQELKEAKVAAVLLESAQRYSFLADAMPLIIWTARPDGCLDYYNKGWFDYTGLTLEQTKDWGWGTVLHPDDLHRCIDRWTHCFTTGENYEIEYRFKRGSDGTYRWFLGRASARRNEAGEIVQWVGTGTDIDDQKNSQSKLEHSVAERTAELAATNESLLRQQTELRALFDLIPAMICFKDTRNIFLQVNQRFAEAAGRSVEEIEGKSAFDLFPKESAMIYVDDLELIHSHAPKMVRVHKARDRNGSDQWIQTNKVPVCDKDGKVTGIVLMAEDITERRLAESKVRESEERYRSVIDNANDAIFTIAADGTFTSLNPAVAAIAGLSRDEWIGKPFAPMVHPGDLPLAVKMFRHVLKGEPVPLHELRGNPSLKRPALMEMTLAALRDDSGKINGVLGIGRDITERRLAENVLLESEERFASAFECAPNGVALVAPDGRWLKVNRALCNMVGYTEAELLGRTYQDITAAEDLASCEKDVRRLLAGEVTSQQSEKRYVHKDGRPVPVSFSLSLVRNGAGEPLYMIAQIQDITERKRIEIQLIQSQKLETVGKLAGGIAHEFNSILTAIIGQSELLLEDLPQKSPLTGIAIEITKAAGRAAALTRQLLAYGRKQMLRPEVLDLNSVLINMESALLHLMGPNVNVSFVRVADLKSIKADTGQIEQVIMNVVMNARDAMPNGGKLLLETANVTLDDDYVSRFPEAEVKAGDYVMLAITDTGMGMTAETKARVFEPFFTTKGVGDGPGLGLSTCYGIVKQSGGNVSVYSEPGRGTTFKIYLPQIEAVADAPSAHTRTLELPRGIESILLVEDDPALREMAGTLLRRLGYTVLTAADGIEALRLKQQRDAGHIDLLFTDVIMPHMNGKELAGRMKALYPHTKILFTSAYTENAIVHQGVLDKGVALLQKPFTPSALAHKLREVLDA